MVEKALPSFFGSDVINSIDEFNELLRANIFTEENIKNKSPLVKATFTYLLILLRDLLAKANKYGSSKVDFQEHVKVDNDIKNVTDLVKFMRDSMCHVESDNHFLDKNVTKAELIICCGKKDLFVYHRKDGDIEFRSLFDDDICFFLGSKSIYFNRHIKRAFDEAVKSLSGIEL